MRFVLFNLFFSVFYCCFPTFLLSTSKVCELQSWHVNKETSKNKRIKREGKLKIEQETKKIIDKCQRK